MPLAKRCTLVKKRPDVSSEAFAAHWLGPHAELAQRVLPTLRRYEVNVVDRTRSPNAPYDGIAAFWFDDWKALDEAFDGEARERLREDAGSFVASTEVHDVVETVVRG
jgi:uncharacterized protein (TIGR02118 family)